MSILEKEIERYLTVRCRTKKWECWKLVSPGRRGVPDRMILMPHGKMVFVELKAPGKKLRLLQVSVQITLKELGFQVFVIDSKKKVDELIKKLSGEEKKC